MRLPTFVFSLLVHGGAIGALAAVGVYANDQAPRTPRVEIQSSVARAPSSEQVPTEVDLAPDVVPEASPMAAELPQDPIVEERELYREVIEDTESTTWAEFRVSLARIKSPAVAEPAPVEPVVERAEETEIVPPPVAPAPASVHIAASPWAGNEAPPYPEHERALGREGTVLVTVTIDKHGVVLAAKLAKGSRYAGFNRAALAAVRKWRFTPGMVDGAPIQDEIDVPVVFRFDDIK